MTPYREAGNAALEMLFEFTCPWICARSPWPALLREGLQSHLSSTSVKDWSMASRGARMHACKVKSFTLSRWLMAWWRPYIYIKKNKIINQLTTSTPPHVLFSIPAYTPDYLTTTKVAFLTPPPDCSRWYIDTYFVSWGGTAHDLGKQPPYPRALWRRWRLGWSRRTARRAPQWAAWARRRPSCRSPPVAAGWRWPPRTCNSLPDHKWYTVRITEQDTKCLGSCADYRNKSIELKGIVGTGWWNTKGFFYWTRNMANLPWFLPLVCSVQ